MEILKIINAEAVKEGHKFIVIGGHALNAHGISRATGDLDMMVARSESDFWVSLLEKLKYVIFQRTSAFIQSKAPIIEAWSIDLMLVDDTTLQKALLEAVTHDHSGATAPTASVSHLIAMKLHALKSNQVHRLNKDMGDLLSLLEIKGMKIDSQEFRQICMKYANLELYEKIASNYSK